jgi:hypothetical protein
MRRIRNSDIKERVILGVLGVVLFGVIILSMYFAFSG